MVFTDFFDLGTKDFEKIKFGSRYINDEKIAGLVTSMTGLRPVFKQPLPRPDITVHGQGNTIG